MRGGRAWIVAAALVLVAGAGVAFYVLEVRSDTTTTGVPVDLAVDRFREETGATRVTAAPPASDRAGSTGPAATTTARPAATAPTTIAAPPVLPPPGVYSYTTSGGDRIDALGGASHTYPATSTITVTVEGCGVRQRWVAAEERWDELVTCAVPGGVATMGFTAFHRFFGQDELEPHACTGEPRPLAAPPGRRWTATCTIGDHTTTWRGEVLPPQTVRVGATAVDTDHVVVNIDDGTADTQRTQTWYLQGTDLVVRRVVDNATTNPSPIGDVHYEEHYEITLDALVPVT